jgi:NADH-quinone oxidoreductase subunit C
MDQTEATPQGKGPLDGCPEPLHPVLTALESAFSGIGFSYYFFRDEAVVTVPTEKVIEVLGYLKTEQGFNYLVDVGGLHDPKAAPAFTVFYNLLSIEKTLRLRVKTGAPGDPPRVPTATSLWEGANWHEREAWDMMGILFTDHPDLRRMFLPEHVDFHPLRKEYPLRGDNDKPTW